MFAIASGAARAAVTVMRVSGPRAGPIVDALCGRRPRPHVASLRRLRLTHAAVSFGHDDIGSGDAVTGADGRRRRGEAATDQLAAAAAWAGDVIDAALVIWFPAPRSYTGEDVAEFHLHGGRAVQIAMAAALTALGAVPAEPGAFTLRAFRNGRLDLLQAEAVADLVDAETDAQRRQALRQLEGDLGSLYQGWADRLRDIVAQQEALLDFPDEDLPDALDDGLSRAVADLRDAVAAHLADGHRGERLRDGLEFAIVGAPNAGKSTLLNALAGRDVAIVSAVPGTTRDVLEARLVFGGVPVTLLDTAGLHAAADPVEAEGVRRALARAASADLVIQLLDRREADEPPLIPARGDVIRVLGKADLMEIRPDGALAVSGTTGEGLGRLRTRLIAEAIRLTQAEGPPPLTRARHRVALTEMHDRLAAAARATAELRAEDLRLALRALGRVTGTVGVEDILDSIFRQFCIGK